MSQQFEINAEIRNDLGKSVSRRMRHNGHIPAIVYGAKQDPQSLTLSHREIFHTLENEAAYSHILDLKIEGKSEKVVIKAIQRHPFKPKITHIDFLRISATDKITMQVPLHFIGEDTSAGVKSGGIISKLMTEVEVRCLPSDLPEFIELNISELELDHSLHLSDLKLPSGVELTTQIDDSHNPSVINISTPKAATSEESAEDATEEAAEDNNDNNE